MILGDTPFCKAFHLRADIPVLAIQDGLVDCL
jgi:hypothetical protein